MDAPGRVVLDPNVLVSAAITSSGATAEILELIDASVITPVVSPALLTELTLVLRRDKFRAYLEALWDAGGEPAGVHPGRRRGFSAAPFATAGGPPELVDLG